MARTRATKPKVRAQKAGQTSGRQSRWWKKGDKFVVDYIEYAETAIVNGTRMWIYNTKWYLYSRSENTGEPASTFTECEHPILARFWKSVKKQVAPGCVEPDVGCDGDPYVIFYSPQAYRRREAAETLEMTLREALEDSEPEDSPSDSSAPVSTSERTPEMEVQSAEINTDSETESETETPVDFHQYEPDREEQKANSDEEVEALLMADAFSYLEVQEQAVSPTPPPALLRPPVSEPPMSHADLADFTFLSLCSESNDLLNNGTVAPLETILPRSSIPSAPSRLSKSNPFSVLYPAIQHNNTHPALLFTGNSFRSTPDISLKDKEVSRFKWLSGLPPPERRQRKIRYFNEVYTKVVNKRTLEQLRQAPPSMEVAEWSEDANTLPSMTDEGTSDVIFDEYIQEPAMVTTGEVETPASDLGVIF